MAGRRRARLDAIMNALAATSFGARVEDLALALGCRAGRIQRDLDRLEHDHLVTSDIVIRRVGGTSITWRLRWDEWRSEMSKATPSAALRTRLEDWVENALDPQAAASAALGVLELHQPFTRAGMVLCRECSPARDSEGRHYVLMPWPCPTWKAIAEPFGIEAPEVGDDA